MTRSEPEFPVCHLPTRAAPGIKHELALNWPDFRFAYSPPGFLTFKLPAGHQLREDFDLRSVFARAYGFCLAKIAATDPAEAARQVWQVAAELAIERLHVWQRGTGRTRLPWL